MIGGLKLARAGGIGVNANDVDDLLISLLLSPLTTDTRFESVGARLLTEVAPTVAAVDARLSLRSLKRLDAISGKRVCHSYKRDNHADPVAARQRHCIA
jgi:hypothetical protein